MTDHSSLKALDKIRFKLRKELDKWDRVELDHKDGTTGDYMAVDFVIDKLAPVVQAANNQLLTELMEHKKAIPTNVHETSESVDVSNSKVNRFEVIDDTGRAYVKGSIYGSPVSVKLDYQDDGRTLKVFVTPTDKDKT